MNGDPGYSSFDPSTWYIPYEPTFPYVETTTPSQVHTGMDPVTGLPYATDTPALVPLAPVPESNPQMPTFNWQDPLDLEGLQFPESTPQTPGLEAKFGGYAEQPVVYPPGTSYEIAQPAGGPIEWIVDAAGNVIDFGKSVVEFIGEHLDVGISYQYPGQTRPSQFPSVVLAGKEGSPISPMVFTIPGGIQSRENGGAPAAPAYAPMSEDERLLYEAQQQSQSDLGRFLLYGGLAFLAYKLLSKKG